MDNENKQTKKIILISVSIVVALIAIVLIILLALKKKQTEEPVEIPKPEYKQCYEKPTENEQKKSNWKHNSLNYEIDENSNRINNSSKIKEEHNLGNGITLANMSIFSENCNEIKANLEFDFINNSGKDITLGTVNFLFTNEENSEGVRTSVDVSNIKNGETFRVKTSYRVRIIDAYDFTATFFDSSQMEG